MKNITDNMTDVEVKDAILQFLRSVNREGIEKVVEYLENEKMSDFFTAPASTKYHLACAGGLARHSLNVYYRLLSLVTLQKDTYRAISEEEYAKMQDSIVLVALLHDVCKTNFYKLGSRNVKNEKTGQWEKVPCYTIQNDLPMGHGEKSMYIVSSFIKLTREEAIAIRWHMGPYDEAAKGGSYDIGAAFEKYPLAAMLHAADMLAANLDEATAPQS